MLMSVQTLTAETSENQFSSGAWRQALRSDAGSWSRVSQLTELKSKTHLEGKDRQQVIELLGQPQRSDEVLPRTAHRSILDFYKLSSTNDQHFCVQYDSQDKVLSSYVEPAPLVVPRYMGHATAAARLAETQLNEFLDSRTDYGMRKLKVKDVERMLGVPSRSWQATARAGGQEREWLTYLYFLSPSGCRACVVTFDGKDRQIYEYRIHTIASER